MPTSSYAVWRFPVTLGSEFSHMMPVGTKVLCVKTEGDQPALYCFVNNATIDMELRRFLLVSTAEPIPIGLYYYCGTFSLEGQDGMNHLFEIGDPKLLVPVTG